MRAPCKDCPDRTVEPNCHTTCAKYLEYRAILDERNENKRLQKEISFMRSDAVFRGTRAALKMKKSKGR